MKNIRAIITMLICLCVLSGAVSLLSMYRSFKVTEKYSDLKTNAAELKSGIQKQLNELKSSFVSDDKKNEETPTEMAAVETDEAKIENAAAVTFNSESPDKPTEKYTMKICNGSIGIFDNLGTQIRVLDTSVDSLSENDRILLTNGISTSSWEEMLGLIQDYTS